MRKQLLAIFIGAIPLVISIIPVINAEISRNFITQSNLINEKIVKISEQNNLVKITVEFYGLTEYKNNTFYLNREESDRFNSIYDEFNNSIHKANSMIEMEIIYKNTLNNLSEIGIVNSTEVIEDFNSIKTIYNNVDHGFLENLTIKGDLEYNYLPFIALRANFAYFLPPSILFLSIYGKIYSFLKEKFPIFFRIYEKIIDSIMNKIIHPGYYNWGIVGLFLIWVLWVFFNPFPIGYAVSLSAENQKNLGWVHAVGLLGVQDITGEYQGALAGFTGLRIFKDSDFFMYGIALASVLGE